MNKRDQLAAMRLEDFKEHLRTIRTVGLDGVPDGYRAMNEREAIKVMVKPVITRSQRKE